MRPFWCYYGAKWRLAPHYPAPVHDRIIEPFAGAAGYTVRNEPTRAVLVDSDPTVAGLWRWLLTLPDPRLILDLPDLAPGQSTRDLDVPDEARWLIGWWINKGTERPFFTPSKWIREGWRPKSSWGPEVRHLLASQLAALKTMDWHVSQMDYRSIAPVEATWFIDPPYSGRGGDRYVHGNRGFDYAELGEWCRSLPGQVIVCESEGADWLPFRPLVDAKTSRTRRSAEVFWTNE